MPIARYIPPPQAQAQADDTPAGRITAAELAPIIGATGPQAMRLLAVVSERVEFDAPGAPQAVKNESIIRFAGYLAQSDYGGVRKEGIGPKDIEWVINHANAWRNSGAAALLAPWKIRRAGAIG